MLHFIPYCNQMCKLWWVYNRTPIYVKDVVGFFSAILRYSISCYWECFKTFAWTWQPRLIRSNQSWRQRKYNKNLVWPNACKNFKFKKKYGSFYYHQDPYVLLYCVMYLDFIQAVVMPVSTAVTVTSLVLQTVKTARAIYRVERVSCVNLVGLMCIVRKVRP